MKKEVSANRNASKYKQRCLLAPQSGMNNQSEPEISVNLSVCLHWRCVLEEKCQNQVLVTSASKDNTL